jgi:hypothetical protein
MDLKGSGSGIIEVISKNYSGRTEENYEETRVSEIATRPTAETKISQT